MTDFTASNGITVAIERNGSIYAIPASLGVDHEVSWRHVANDLYAEALREFFQHDRDTELGRWRWPENPDYVVYQVTDARSQVRVMHEPTATTCHVNDGQGYLSESLAQYVAAGEAYFAAHPEPKPWHDAKPGEVWVITTSNVADERAVQVTPKRTFQYNEAIEFPKDFPLTYEAIETAHRIWPVTS